MTDDTAPCIAAEIWRRARERHPRIDRAQDRAALDDTLRELLSELECVELLKHAAQILRQLRARAFFEIEHGDIGQRIELLENRIANLEAGRGSADGNAPPREGKETAAVKYILIDIYR